MTNPQPVEPPQEIPANDNLLSAGLMFDDNTLPTDHRSGFIAVVGRPNVGKSTLLNAYLEQKISIVSPKAQTTRNQLLGILTLPHAQLVFVDTPGIHQPYHKFGEYMVEAARRSILDADLVLWLVDGTNSPTPEDKLVAQMIAAVKQKPPVILAVNKIDLLTLEQVENCPAEFTTLLHPDLVMPVSALTGQNRQNLLKAIITLLPPGPRFFPEEQITDQQTRFIAAELIREAALQVLHREVPHALAVIVEEFNHRSDNLIYIDARLFVERDSQKGIVIGHKGQTLKQIGQLARPQIENLVEAKVFLDLRVKVKPKWRKNLNDLKDLGYSVAETG